MESINTDINKTELIKTEFKDLIYQSINRFSAFTFLIDGSMDRLALRVV